MQKERLDAAVVACPLESIDHVANMIDWRSSLADGIHQKGFECGSGGRVDEVHSQIESERRLLGEGGLFLGERTHKASDQGNEEEKHESRGDEGDQRILEQEFEDPFGHVT